MPGPGRRPLYLVCLFVWIYWNGQQRSFDSWTKSSNLIITLFEKASVPGHHQSLPCWTKVDIKFEYFTGQYQCLSRWTKIYIKLEYDTGLLFGKKVFVEYSYRTLLGRRICFALDPRSLQSRMMLSGIFSS